jgi:hypothetical protein
MSATAIIVVIVIVVSALAVLVFVASRIAAGTARQPSTSRPSQGPEYRHSPETVQYYGQVPMASEKQSLPDKRPAPDPRRAPLPRCPGCGAATAYGDQKCRRCGRDLVAT